MAIKESYRTPEVEEISYLHAVKDWLSPHLREIVNHSRPHAFKFCLDSKGRAGMWYKHWGQKKNGEVWITPMTHFFVLRSMPVTIPPLLKTGLFRTKRHAVDATTYGIMHGQIHSRRKRVLESVSFHRAVNAPNVGEN